MYAYCKKDSSGHYTKIMNAWTPSSHTKEYETISQACEEYNQANYRKPMQITLFTYFLENVIKTNRAVNSTLKGTILLA